MRKFMFMLLFFPIMITAHVEAQQYIIVGWNDLGMHFYNPNFSNFAFYPPGNNIYSHVILKGDSLGFPQTVTQNIRVSYEIPGNTYSVGKTNFWDFEDQLFGVSLLPNIGLTGAGLTGDMAVLGNAFRILGVPVTPFPDTNLTQEDPLQLGLLTAYLGTNPVAQTPPVVPVSTQLNCVSGGCHSSEAAILNTHPDEGGFNPDNTPILCTSCHASNASGSTGQGGTPNFSEAIHGRHGGITNDCYKCHPSLLQRGVMSAQFGMTCQSCHGSVSNVAQTIDDGRRPWLDEPTCGAAACHGSQFAEESGKLFKDSKGHAGLYCSTCHGSPHAIYPSGNDRDNVQIIALQGTAGTLTDCRVCHGRIPSSPGPHGFVPVAVQEEKTLPSVFSLLPNYPNPFNPSTTISFNLQKGGIIRVTVLNETGQEVAVLIDKQYFPPGNYERVFNSSNFATGIFYVMLDVDGVRTARRMTLMK